MSNFVLRTIDRCFAVAGAFFFCQAPEVMKQYSALLSGHLAESKLQMLELQKLAELSQKTVPEYIQKFISQPDADFMRQGQLLQKLVVRNAELTAAYTDMQQADIWMKPFIFIQKMELSIFTETMEQFTPGLAFNTETIAYAFVGILLGMLVYRIIRGGFRALFSRKSTPVVK